MRHAAMRTRVRGSMRRSNEGVGWCQVHNDASECVRVCGMACRIVLHREIRLHTESHHLATTLPRCRIARRCSACCNALPCQKQQRTPAARGRVRQHMQGATTFLHTHTHVSSAGSLVYFCYNRPAAPSSARSPHAAATLACGSRSSHAHGPRPNLLGDARKVRAPRARTTAKGAAERVVDQHSTLLDCHTSSCTLCADAPRAFPRRGPGACRLGRPDQQYPEFHWPAQTGRKFPNPLPAAFLSRHL